MGGLGSRVGSAVSGQSAKLTTALPMRLVGSTNSRTSMMMSYMSKLSLS